MPAQRAGICQSPPGPSRSPGAAESFVPWLAGGCGGPAESHERHGSFQKKPTAGENEDGRRGGDVWTSGLAPDSVPTGELAREPPPPASTDFTRTPHSLTAPPRTRAERAFYASLPRLSFFRSTSTASMPLPSAAGKF
jgi:hypothetical protein